MRNLLTRIVPQDPLAKKVGSKYKAYILTSPKDLQILPYTIKSILDWKINIPIDISIIGPGEIEEEILSIIKQLSSTLPLKFISDEVLLGMGKLKPSDFSGNHPKMLTLKYFAAYFSEEENNLILDGDTVFLKGRNWVSEEQQILVLSQEYLKIHIGYCREEFFLKSDRGLGFTTQCQLFKKSIVQDIANFKGGIDNLGQNFSSVYNARDERKIFPAEWQLYGDWIIERSQCKWILAANANYSCSRNFLKIVPGNLAMTESYENFDIAIFRRFSGHLSSISFHDYK